MTKRLLFDSPLLKVTISRLCQQLIEVHEGFSESVIIGLQPRGIFLAERIKKTLETLCKTEIHLGYLDTTFYRDDFRKHNEPLQASQTKIPFSIENKRVILIDDVLYTGRSVRAALDAMNAFGRPSKVELLVLIDRLYSRDIPIKATYVGQKVNSIQFQRVLVELDANQKEDHIWLMTKEI